MPELRRFDVLIIGGGQAGPPLADALARAGKRVALAERRHLGGSCVNFGCTPTKAVIASARVAHLARRGADFGLNIPQIDVDFAAVIRRAREIALKSRSGLDAWMTSADNPLLLRGHARLEGRTGSAFRVRVGDESVVATELVLDTGTRTLVPPIEGLKTIAFVHAGNWLDLEELPQSIAIVGGGAIGLEMAQFYRRMGSRVFVIEAAARIAAREDSDVSDALHGFLASEGIEFRLGTAIERIEARESGALLQLRGSAPAALSVSHVFVATGRKPNSDDLGLDTVGVAMNAHGFIEVDERLHTNVPGIWAAGDARVGPQFTHTAWDDYRILFSQLAGDRSRTTDRIVPYAIFTDPELGRVGMTETEARRSGRPIKIGRFDMARNGKATEIGETKGFIKVVVDANSNRILGAAVLSVDAAELVHGYIDLMNANAPAATMADAIHIHPTLMEAAQSAVAAIA
ncbi:MAG TPA: mercuric reductase [Stellaceae bacterium]|nr:mercuric reductase [Stellaceae bacterium]